MSENDRKPTYRAIQTNGAGQTHVCLRHSDNIKVTRGTMLTCVGNDPLRQLTIL